MKFIRHHLLLIPQVTSQQIREMKGISIKVPFSPITLDPKHCHCFIMSINFVKDTDSDFHKIYTVHKYLTDEIKVIVKKRQS